MHSPKFFNQEQQDFVEEIWDAIEEQQKRKQVRKEKSIKKQIEEWDPETGEIFYKEVEL